MFSECRILDSIAGFSFHNDSVARQTKPFKQSNDKIGFVSAHEYDTGTRITARQLNSREHPIDCIANGNLASIRRDFRFDHAPTKYDDACWQASRCFPTGKSLLEWQREPTTDRQDAHCRNEHDTGYKQPAASAAIADR